MSLKKKESKKNISNRSPQNDGATNATQGSPKKNPLGFVPNLFTLGNLWLGFFAILLCVTYGESPRAMALAGGFIVLAVLCDGLDGAAARLLNARSELGAQLDSLADLTTFGIAPAVVLYRLIFIEYNWVIDENFVIPVGMLLCAIYPGCAAYRLARFNVTHSDESFVGLPSPVAGTIVGLMPLAFREAIPIPSAVLAGIFILVAFLMVSTIRYSKPQVTMMRRFSRGRLVVVALFMIISLVYIGYRYGFDFAAAGLFTIVVIYIISGLVILVIQAIQELRM